jgi:hypothetical protein
MKHQTKSSKTSCKRLLKQNASRSYRLKIKQQSAQMGEKIATLQAKNRILEKELEDIHFETMLLLSVMPFMAKCEKDKSRQIIHMDDGKGITTRVRLDHQKSLGIHGRGHA